MPIRTQIRVKNKMEKVILEYIVKIKYNKLKRTWKYVIFLEENDWNSLMKFS